MELFILKQHIHKFFRVNIVCQKLFLATMCQREITPDKTFPQTFLSGFRREFVSVSLQICDITSPSPREKIDPPKCGLWESFGIGIFLIRSSVGNHLFLIVS